MSQSPQIGASLRTETDDSVVDELNKSQSPQIEASLRTETDDSVVDELNKSQSPQIGASLRTDKCVATCYAMKAVSIPSNRGKPSDPQKEGERK